VVGVGCFESAARPRRGRMAVAAITLRRKQLTKERTVAFPSVSPSGMPSASPVPSVSELAADLRVERNDLISVIERCDRARWMAPSAAPGWSIRDQAAHLVFYDRLAALAIADARAFGRHREMALADVDRYEHTHLDLVPRGIHALIASWLDAATLFETAVHECDSAIRVPWFGPLMSLRSMITARLMETWVHGHDVRDAIGAPPAISPRLRHIADIGVRARPYGYLVRDLTPPTEPVAVVLTGPGPTTWTWGPADAHDRVEGPAEDFCLVLARRRHIEDTALQCRGSAAESWMQMGQMYAGPPGVGPRRLSPPGQP
jgi:uncharacterized protein (TIGR03084 family)